MLAARGALGAEVVCHGRDFDEAREHCEKRAAEDGYRYIHSGNEPSLIAGVATCSLEILPPALVARSARGSHRGRIYSSPESFCDG